MSCCFEFLGTSSTAGAQGSTNAGDKGSQDAGDGHSMLLAAVRSSREFQSQKHTSAREAVSCFLELAALACGFDLYLYSTRESRGRQAVIMDDEISSPFRIIASSNREAKLWHGAPIDHEAVLSGTYASVQTAKVMSDYGHEGVLLVDFRPSGLSPVLAEAVGLWASVLGERLSLIETISNEQNARQAVHNTMEIVSKMVSRAQNGDYNSCMQVVGDIIPGELLKGSINPDCHRLWSLEREEEELVQNDTGKYDGPRVPVSDSIIGIPVAGTKKGKVVCMQRSSDAAYTQVPGTSSTICIPVTLIDDEVSDSLCWRRTSAYPGVRKASDEKDTQEKPRSQAAQVGADIAVIQLSWSNNGMQNQRPFDHFDLVCAEALPDTLLPKMIKMRDFFHRLDEVAHQREGLDRVMEHLSAAATITEVATLVESEVAEALHCEVCTFFFIDDKHDEIWAPQKDTLPDGLCMAFGVGLVGHVAKKAREAKEDDTSSFIEVTNDPQSSTYWKGDVAGFKTRNIMTAPVWSAGRDRRLLGVIQILNKAPMMMKKWSGNSSPVSRDVGFTNVDVEFLQLLSRGVGEILERLLLDVMCAKINLDTHHHSKRSKQTGGTSMFNEYYVSGGATKTVYRANECMAVAMIMDKEKIQREELDFDKMLSATKEAREDADVTQWRVDYWSLNNQEQFRLVLHALEESEALKELTVSRASLYNFFENIKETYRDLPYHNFWHALSTVHYAHRMVLAAGVTQNLTKADLFAIVIAGLCHDCDHRGHNTAFEVATRSELAIRYNDNSPLENHHCAVAFEVAFGGTENCNIFEQLSTEVYVQVRQRMVAGILSTDMKCHGDHVKLVQNFQVREGVDNSQNQFLVELFLHAADIGNPYMPRDISRKWGAFIAAEFTRQVEHERQAGIPVTSFMDGLTDPVAAAKAQAGFIDFVVSPLVDPMFRIFEGLSDPKQFLKENREDIKKITDQK